MVVVCEVDGCFPTTCMVNEAHAFFNGMGAGIFPCMVFQRVCVCCICDPNESLSAPSICFVCDFVCRKLSPHLGV